MICAPIILFTYKRLSHLRRTVESLLSNPDAKGSLLYVFSDGPRSPSEESVVKEVRAYILSLTGFEKVIPIFRDSNWGLAKSITSGVTEVLRSHEQVIVVEDDLVVAPHFLEFMNSALELYGREERVASICAYFYPVSKPLPETFFLREADCWGWATWRRGWAHFNPDGKSLLKQIESRGLEQEFDVQGCYPYTQMLRNQIEGKNNSWAIRWQASLFLADKLTLYPGRSLARNIGFDKSGEHCGATAAFDVEGTQERIIVGGVPVEESKECEGIMAEYFRRIEAPRGRSLRTRVGQLLRKMVGA